MGELWGHHQGRRADAPGTRILRDLSPRYGRGGILELDARILGRRGFSARSPKGTLFAGCRAELLIGLDRNATLGTIWHAVTLDRYGALRLFDDFSVHDLVIEVFVRQSELQLGSSNRPQILGDGLLDDLRRYHFYPCSGRRVDAQKPITLVFQALQAVDSGQVGARVNQRLEPLVAIRVGRVNRHHDADHVTVAVSKMFLLSDPLCDYGHGVEPGQSYAFGGLGIGKRGGDEGSLYPIHAVLTSTPRCSANPL